MATEGNKLSTPALLPWIPPGKPKESSSNILVNKKNSGNYDMGQSIASSMVFNQPNKKKVSLTNKFWSPKKNSRKLTLGSEKERRIETLLNSSVNSQAEKDLLKSKIMGIFDEAEERERNNPDYKNGRRKRHNSDPGSAFDMELNEKSLRKSSTRVLRKNSDSHRKDDDESTKNHVHRTGENSRQRKKKYGEDEYQNKTTRKTSNSSANNHNHNSQTRKNIKGKNHKDKSKRSLTSEESSGFGSLPYTEELDDRNSIKFIDSYDLYAPKRDTENSDLGFYENENTAYHEERHDIFIDDIERDPRYKIISSEVEVQTEPFPDTNNKPTLIHAMPNVIYDQEAPYHTNRNTYVNNSVASSRLGFASIPLRHRDDPSSSLPEAWLVYPKGTNPVERNIGVQSRNVESILSVPQSYTIKPVNLASSIGSRLRQSFATLNSLKNDTPVEQFNYSDQENLVNSNPFSEEEKRERRKKSALLYGGGACCGLILLIAVVVGIALLATYLGPGSKYDEGINPVPQRFPKNLNTTMCFEGHYKNLTDSWRRITGQSPSDNKYRCDKETNRGGFQTKGWYRFVGDAGTYLSTTPPAFHDGKNEYEESCGTSYIGWMKGTHPTISDGLVKREFCFQSRSGECQWTIMSQVRTCPVGNEYTILRNRIYNTKTFYVYYLMFPKDLSCNAAYCAL